jgi:hypothetical protein
MLEERFAGVLEGARASEALLYWPITAGGLGLCNPMLVMIGFRRSRQRRPPIPPPAALPDDAGWRDNDNPWSTYYRQHLQPLAPERPEIAPELEGLRAQFLARGNARSLTAYWEWVLSTYGPQLLQGFGALSVLFPQLVPMQLVVNSQKITSSLDREMATAKSRAPSVYLPSVDFDDDIPF